MGYDVRILPSAHEEVDEIVGFLLSRSRGAATRFLEAYETKLKLLGSGTVDFGFSHLPELARLGYHTCLVDSYVMLYYREGDTVVIAHVFHHSRNYARLVVPPRPSEGGTSSEQG